MKLKRLFLMRIIILSLVVLFLVIGCTSNNESETMQQQINDLTNTIDEKEQQINSLQTTILEKEKTIKELEQKSIIEEKQLLQICPDEWYDNQMPRAVGFENPQQNYKYFVLDGKRREMSEFDLNWVFQNCDIEVQVVV